MTNGKWITDLSTTTPLDDAARQVLAVRLEVVHDHLPHALQNWQDDPEHIHQLRVGTRRGGAALAIFSLCLPPKVYRNTRKRLRKLRRAAGAARDWDVFGMDLAEREQHATAPQRPGLDFLLGYTNAQRVAAQATLESVGAEGRLDLERLISDTVAAVHQPCGQIQQKAFGELAGPWLSGVLNELKASASVNLDQYEHLHRVRILGKRLRYGMEIFAVCFEDDFKNRYYPLVEEMQEILGLANDSHVAVLRMTALRDLLRSSQPALWKRFRAGVEGLLRYHQHRLPVQRRHFLRWWAHWEKSGAEAGLMGMVQGLGSND